MNNATRRQRGTARSVQSPSADQSTVQSPGVPRRSVYRRQCPQLAALFASAGDASRVALVAMDYAKREHRVLIVDGAGSVLCGAFDVHNTTDGVEFLREKVAACLKRHRIEPAHVCYGGEDEPAWAANFLSSLCATSALVLRVNARDAKDLRDNHIASTDTLDLLGIAKCLLIRKAQPIHAHMTRHDEQARRTASLRDLMRQRRRMVYQRTATQNHIHALVDKLCPGFLDEAKSGLVKFGPASLALMSGRFSVQELARRQVRGLITELTHAGVSRQRAELKAAQIQQLARTALPPDAALVPALQRSLKSNVTLLLGLNGCIDDLECAMAEELSRLPAAVFTTIPGISIVLASGLAAELGPHLHEKNFSSQCAYAGIVPGTAQSGGSESPAVQTRAPKRCNRILKDYLVQAACKQQQYGPPEFKEAFLVMKAEGKHAEFAIARRLLRTLRAMHQQHSPYMPPTLRLPPNKERTKAQTVALRVHLHDVFEKLCRKWAVGPDWHHLLGEDRELGIIFRVFDSLLDLGLSWPRGSPAPMREKRPARRTRA
jgi:transposase